MGLSLVAPNCRSLYQPSYRALGTLATRSCSNATLKTHSPSPYNPYNPYNLAKRTLVTTPQKVLNAVYFNTGCMIKVDPNFKHDTIPTSSKWTKPTPIKIIHLNKRYETATKTHYFVGGIPALMQAVYKIHELGKDSSEQVIYINDGKVPKSIQSGHQGHVHPSEWASDECHIPSLFKTMLQGLNVIKKPTPYDLNEYSYLHFPLSLKEIAKHPIKFTQLYGKFFKQRIIHNITSKNGVSKQDRWLCEAIRKSLEFHTQLSDKIEIKTGLPTFKSGFRVYWSIDTAKIEKKKQIWEELNIPCEMMDNREIMEHTLLRLDRNIHVLKVIGDGNFYPETPQRIIDYVKGEFPNFNYRIAELKELILDKAGNPSAIKEINPQTNKESFIPISSFFCSPGHNEVYDVDPITKTETKLWEETPVSGVSTLWKCTIGRKEIEKRFGLSISDKKKLIEISNKLVASANLTNLHITPVSAEISPDGESIIHIVRGTQGANFNSTVADHDDLINMCVSLNEYYIGDWDLLSVGTCTRKTGESNVPEIVNGLFGTRYSGIGYSASAIPPDMQEHPRL